MTNLLVSFTGQYPGVSAVPDRTNTFVMVYNDTSGNLYSRVGTVNFPT